MIYFRDLSKKGRTMVVVESLTVIPRVGEWVVIENKSYEVDIISYDWPNMTVDDKSGIKLLSGNCIVNVHVKP